MNKRTIEQVYGKQMGKAYYHLVMSYISKVSTKGDMLLIFHLSKNAVVAQEIIEMAKEQFRKETMFFKGGK